MSDTPIYDQLTLEKLDAQLDRPRCEVLESCECHRPHRTEQCSAEASWVARLSFVDLAGEPKVILVCTSHKNRIINEGRFPNVRIEWTLL